MKFLKSIGLYVVIVVVSFFISPYFGKFYGFFFPQNIGGSLPTDFSEILLGTPLAYVFFLTLLFTAFGGKGRAKYWWIGILLIPALWFEINFDLMHLYVPLILGILGWLIGFAFIRLMKKQVTTPT